MLLGTRSIHSPNRSIQKLESTECGTTVICWSSNVSFSEKKFESFLNKSETGLPDDYDCSDDETL